MGFLRYLFFKVPESFENENQGFETTLQNSEILNSDEIDDYYWTLHEAAMCGDLEAQEELRETFEVCII